MGWCALIRRMHMDNHCRQHIGYEIYTVTVCEVVAARVCYKGRVSGDPVEHGYTGGRSVVI